jgi:hypothetical protein
MNLSVAADGIIFSFALWDSAQLVSPHPTSRGFRLVPFIFVLLILETRWVGT